MMNLDVNKIADLVAKAAIDSIDDQMKDTGDRVFFALAVETLAEERYFQICLGTTDDIDRGISRYKESGIDSNSAKNEILSNPQEWELFDFNRKQKAWNAHWQTIDQQLETFQGSIEHEEFLNFFKAFTDIAMERIVSSGVLDSLQMTEDFRVFYYEHHDLM